MTVALVATSHSPLMGIHEPAAGVAEAVQAEFDGVRRFVADFDPDLVVLFGPDHYNGVFYDMLPPFCIGAQATSVGDWGTAKGPLDVDHGAAMTIAAHALACELDLALSERMHVDHGFAQPLEVVFGAIDAIPVVPIFINSVAEPMGPARRARLLGRAVGEAAATLDRRVLLMGSGGLSHDPPVPTLVDASPEVAERLIAGRDPSADTRASREAQQVETARRFAAGEAPLRPLNPHWDLEFLDVIARGELERVDGWSNEWFVEQAGHSSHEVRTWIAAYAALAASGPYQVLSSFYREIPEWIAGFAITTAIPRDH